MPVNLVSEAAIRREAAIQLRKQNVIARGMEKAVAVQLRQIGIDAAAAVKDGGVTAGLLAVDRAMPRMQRVLAANYTVALTTFGLHAIEHSGKSFRRPLSRKDAFGELDRLIAEWAVQNSALKVAEISKTTRAILAEVVADSFSQGLSVAEVSRRVGKVLGDDTPRWRARLIARTETHSAAMQGSLVGARTVSSSLVKRWVSVSDARTRDSHEDADGQEQKMDDPFNVNGYSLQHPGDPSGPASEICNCRCVMVYKEA